MPGLSELYHQLSTDDRIAFLLGAISDLSYNDKIGLLLQVLERMPSNQERAPIIVKILNELRWGPNNQIPSEVFNAICAAFTTCSFELMVLREVPDAWLGHEVLLVRRSPNDPFYANKYHCTGSLFYGHEQPESVLGRIVARELSGADLSEPVGITGNHFNVKRGSELSLLHVSVLRGEYRGRGEWFRLNQLPDDILGHHRVMAGQVAAWLEDRLTRAA